MAVQTVPTSVNIDNVMTPLFVAVSKGVAATAFATVTIPAASGAVTLNNRAAPAFTNWNGVAYGNEIFLTVSSSTGVTGASQLAASSIDGINWGLRNIGIDASWGAIAFGNGTFVAVVDGSTTAVTTTDGFNWNKHTLERNGNYNTISFGGGQFVALCSTSATAQVSSDGSLWEYRAMPAIRKWKGLAYDSCIGRWVAVASNTNKGAYSNDGSLWVEMTMTKDTSWNSVASNNRGRFVAVTNSADAIAAYSNDGINWNNTNTLQNAFRWKSVCYAENYDPLYQARWVAVSHSTRHASLQFSGRVWLDPCSGLSGTTFPIGTQAYPVNNGPDAKLIADRERIEEFRIQGKFPTSTNLTEVTIAGDTFLDDGLTFLGQTYDTLTFRDLHLDGSANFVNTEFKNCFIENIEGISGEMVNCRLKDVIKIEAGKQLSGVEMVMEGDYTTIDLMNDPSSVVSLDINSGYVKFINGVAGSLIEVNLRGGEIELDPTIVGTSFYAEGVGTLFNYATSIDLKANHLLALETIPPYVWAENITTITDASSAGYSLWNTPKRVLNKIIPFLFAK